MIRHILLSLIFSVAMSFGSFAQSVGIIGDATPGAWDEDTDMVQDPDSLHIWTLRMTLFDGAAKFRQDDDWIVNWGSLDFPSGLGIQDGDNIPIIAGDYDITFNSNTGEYHFDLDSDIGIIGDATPGGWDEDTDMYKDQTDPNKFFIEMDLVAGAAKFRKDDDWIVNWGSLDFPSGIGIQDGDNIPVNPGTRYRITLDTMTGVYDFSSDVSFGTIGIIGDAVNGGWDEDIDLVKDATDGNLWSLQITLMDGEAKFRAEDDWVISWGSTGFPAGTAELGGDNIPVTAGEYFITFNSSTGEYNFKTVEEFATVGIIGDATPGGWDEDTDLIQDASNPHLWSLRMDLIDGEAKFRANNEWVVDWGAGGFPSGTGTQGGANIPIPAGDYIITFNSISGVYNFQEVVEYGTVGIIGKSSPAGDWENETQLIKDASDFNLWTIDAVTLTTKVEDDEGIKFRADMDWSVNWGEDVFPGGIGIQDGPNIPTVAGTYAVSFNSANGEYAFSQTSSTEEILNPNAVSVFPNPTSDLLYVEIDIEEMKGDVQMQVIDISGKVVKNIIQNSNSLQPIDLNDLTNGNYILKITNEDYLITKRFSFQK